MGGVENATYFYWRGWSFTVNLDHGLSTIRRQAIIKFKNDPAQWRHRPWLFRQGLVDWMRDNSTIGV